MKLIYQVHEKPSIPKTVVFAIQQLLAIMAATLVVPILINNEMGLAGDTAMSPAAALFGAGIGTFVYLLFTKFKSPVFLGSSFAFIGSMCAAFAGATSVALGYLGLILGAFFAGLVYVAIAIAIKFAGVNWLNRLMPAVVIGPTVTIIGLSLSGNAVGDLVKGNVTNLLGNPVASPLLCVVCGLVTLVTVVVCSAYGKKTLKLIPFIMGILAGYAAANIFTVIGHIANVDAMKIVSYEAFKALVADGVKFSTFLSLPDFTFLTAFGAFGKLSWSYVATVIVAYAPVAFVVFAEHVADHKNISSIIEKDLLTDPGLSRTLLGDGVGSMAGAFFGGCPNTTYGESVACVAISRNASVITTLFAACGAVLVSFLSPFVAFINTVPSCVMGGVCIALYGFIAVSGLKMIREVDLGENKNLFVVSTILVTGVGGLTLSFGKVTITATACALILGIVMNLILQKAKTSAEENEEE